MPVLRFSTWLSLPTAVLALCLPACTSAPTSTYLRELPVELPMRLRGTEPSIEVFVNGEGPFLFAIDTGCTDFARADSSLVKRLGLPITGLDLTNDASGHNRKLLGTVVLKSLNVGGVEFHDVEASTRDYNHDPNLPHINGILTFDLFADYLLTLDYPAGRVRLEHGALPPADGREVLPLKRVSGLPAVEMTIGDQRVNAEIDSGNILCGFFLPDSLVKRLRLATEPVSMGKASTVSSTMQVSAATLDGSIRIGTHKFPAPTVVFPAPFNFVNIGSPALRDFIITFDQKNRLVRFVHRAGAAANVGESAGR